MVTFMASLLQVLLRLFECSDHRRMGHHHSIPFHHANFQWTRRPLNGSPRYRSARNVISIDRVGIQNCSESSQVVNGMANRAAGYSDRDLATFSTSHATFGNTVSRGTHSVKTIECGRCPNRTTYISRWCNGTSAQGYKGSITT
jgi:hypothetical protein